MSRTKDGWTLVNIHQKVQLGKKQYRNMEEWKRPCRVCASEFFIYTRENAQSVNAAFGLRTCKHHRGMSNGQTVPVIEPIPSDLQQRHDALQAHCHWQEAELQRLYTRVEQLEAELGVHKPPTLTQLMQETKNSEHRVVALLPWPPNQG